MANNLPYLFESNWEVGTSIDNWTTETDTGSRLNVQHYTTLAKYNANSAVKTDSIGPIAPWRGAFCMEIFMGDANIHSLISPAAIALPDTKIGYVQFMLFIGNDFKATADDTFTIYQHQGTANAAEGTIALNIVAATNTVLIGAAQLESGITFGGNALDRGRWLCVELVTTKQVAAQTGTNVLFVDGVQVSTATDTVNGTAVLRGVIGVVAATLATTTGHLFFDSFKFSSNNAAGTSTATRIGVPHDRYPSTVFVTKSTHLALGVSEALNISLIPGADTTAVLKVYDTDAADLQDDTNVLAVLNGTTASAIVDLANVPVSCKRGLYVQLSGTIAPQALVEIGVSQAWGSHGRVRQHGFKRSVTLNPEAYNQ